MDEATEDELVKWVEDMAEEHFAVTIPQFLEHVEAIMKELKIPTRGESRHLSCHFVSDFVTRHPRIEDVFCQGLDDRRAKNAKPEIVNRFFDFVEKLVKDKGMKTFFNLDETCLSGEEMKKKTFKVLYPRLKKGQRPHVRYAEFDGHITYLACSGSNGQNYNPFFIIEGERFTQQFKDIGTSAKRDGLDIPGEPYHMTGKYTQGPKKGQTNKALMTRELYREFIQNTFLPGLKKEDLPAILFVDGHDSHMDTKSLELLAAHNVHCIHLPSHLRYS